MWESVADALWQPWLLLLFLLTGLWFSLRSGFFQLFGLKSWLRGALSCLKREKPGGPGLTRRQALATSLASTIGTGSVAGVATAICLGGPGAVFWMWISALLGLMTGFVEKALAVKLRRRTEQGWEGGPAYWLEVVLDQPLAGRWFSLWCVLSALAGGAVVQSNSIAGALEAAFGLAPAATGLVTALAVGLVSLGGLRSVGRASEGLMPVMALLFLGAGLAALALRASLLPQALSDILRCALTPQAAAGGGFGTAIRYGVARGVFTNEAGVGSSALAHAASGADSPLREGFLGMLEVCFATLVVCTVSALVILTSGLYRPGEDLTGAPLAAAAFTAALGPLGAELLAASVLLFAFTSLLGWCWYGEQELVRLTRSPGTVLPFRLLYLGCIALGAVGQVDGVWAMSDVCTAAMAAVTLPALVKLCPLALRELDDRRE